MRNNPIIDGIEHDLSHLGPFTINVTPNAANAPTYKVLVTFGHHCFTREFDEANDPASHRYTENNETRCFCHDRYAASMNLRRQIAFHSKGKAYFTNKNNYMLLDHPVSGAPYVIFFNLNPAKNIPNIDAMMFVVSAHERNNMPMVGKLQKMSFATLLSKTIRGERITRPKK